MALDLKTGPLRLHGWFSGNSLIHTLNFSGRVFITSSSLPTPLTTSNTTWVSARIEKAIDKNPELSFTSCLMSQIYNLHLNSGESCHQYEAAGKVHQAPHSCCRDWLGKVFFLAGYFFHLQIVRTWRRWESGQNTTFVGPGHPCVVGDWLVYHAWLFDHVAADQVMVDFNCFRSWQLSENRKSPEDSF